MTTYNDPGRAAMTFSPCRRCGEKLRRIDLLIITVFTAPRAGGQARARFIRSYISAPRASSDVTRARALGTRPASLTYVTVNHIRNNVIYAYRA